MRAFYYLIAFLFLVSCNRQAWYNDGYEEALLTTYLKENLQLINGPMVGYSTMTEVAVWIQGKPGVYELIYKDENGLTKKSEPLYILNNKTNNTGLLIADSLTPGKTYTYKIVAAEIDSLILGQGQFTSQPLWQWREDAPDFTFALGSCTYINEESVDRPGTPYGGDYQIFESIYNKNPNFMIWGGDNAYLREVDWHSMSGIWHRFTHSRQVPEMKELLANVHNYAVWDDHDFGPNNSDRSFYLKDSTLKAFKSFWANPSYGINGKPGINTMFKWNDCDFFVMDNRYYRSPNDRKTGERYILGQEQIDWLIDNLVNSQASFKFIVIGNQVLNSAALFENHATYEQERNKLLELIKEEGIKNVVFLSGDRHHSEISKFVKDNYPTLYDITSSPLTSSSHTARDEGNIYQVEGSLIHERNFALLSVSGKHGERELKITYFDVDGKALFHYTIAQE